MTYIEKLETPGFEVDLFDLLGGIPDVLDTLGKDLDELDRYDVIRYAMADVPRLIVEHFPDIFTLDEKAVHPVVMKDLRVEDPQDPKAYVDLRIDAFALTDLMLGRSKFSNLASRDATAFRQLVILSVMMTRYGAMADLLEAIEALFVREIEAR